MYGPRSPGSGRGGGGRPGRLLAASLLLPAVLLAVPARARGADTCAQAEALPRPPIEVLVEPFVDSGTTCGHRSARDAYGDLCGLQSSTYRRPDAVYPVRLNGREGLANRVGFHLDVAEGGDLVLALASRCEQPDPTRDEPLNCVAASLDFIGSGDESIPPQSYPPGLYYLFVDGADDGEGCGGYTLTVSGTNPTPDLRVSLAATPDPVVAGTVLAYTLEVANRGELDAGGVEATLALPPAVAPRRLPEGCRTEGAGRVRCALGSVPRGASRTRRVDVRVDPAARGALGAELTAQAVEGEPTPADNRAAVETGLRAVTSLGLAQAASPRPVVAGCPLVYTLTATNGGPSSALGAVVTDELPVVARFPADPVPHPGCPHPPPECPEGALATCRSVAPGRLECPVGDLAPGASAVVCAPVTFGSSAQGRPLNVASVAGGPGEEERDRSDDRSSLGIPVVRVADLAVGKRAATGSREPGVLVGNTLVYEIAVENLGPSDSSGAAVRDELPPGVSFVSSGHDCEPDGRAVVCRVAPPAGGRSAPTFTAAVDPLVAQPSFSNRARIEADRDPDPNPDNDGAVGATVAVVADLRAVAVELTPEPAAAVAEPGAAGPGRVAAGSNLVAGVEIRNDGESDSPGGEVVIDLLVGDAGPAPELRFLASPDGCAATEAGSSPHALLGVVCPLAPFPAGGAQTVRFVARVPASATAGARIAARAEVRGLTDPDPSDDRVETADAVEVVVEADLGVAVEVSPDPVATGGGLAYTDRVTNLGPSDASAVELCHCLPPGARFDAAASHPCFAPAAPGADLRGRAPGAEDPLSGLQAAGSAACPGEGGEPCPGRVVVCTVGDVPAGAGEVRAVSATVAEEPGRTFGHARVAATAGEAADPVAGNDVAVVATDVVAAESVRLAVSLGDDADPVAAGEPVGYTVAVEHRGPGERAVDGVAVRIGVAAGAVVLEAPGGCEEAEPPGAGLVCRLDGDLQRGDRRELRLVLLPPVGFTGPLSTTARLVVPTDGARIEETGESSETTRIFAAPDLVLPFFRLGAAPAGERALVALRNLGDDAVTAELLAGSSAGEELATESLELGGRAVRSLDLHDLLSPVSADGAPVAGSLGVRRAAPPDPLSALGERLLAGDFTRIGAAGRTATGSLLVDTATVRAPRQLCRRWAVRVLGGAGAGGGTDVAFWLPADLHVPPEPDAAAPKAPIRGRVYSEAGDLVQRLEMAPSQAAFERSTEDLLVDFGVVEWELPAGVVGSVSAIHRSGSDLAVGVPGVCLDPLPAGAEPGLRHPLVVPYYEAGPDPAGSTALLAVRNEGEGTVTVELRYHGLGAPEPVVVETCALAPREVRTVNLRDLPDLDDPRCRRRGEAGAAVPLRGHVEIEAVPPGGGNDGVEATGPVFLSGDYLRLRPAAGWAAAGVLVDTDPGAAPPGICRRWVTRLVHLGEGGTTTDVVLHAPTADGASGRLQVHGVLYGAEGGVLRELDLDLDGVARQVGAGALLPAGGELSGSAEWTFPDDRPGHVSTLLRSEGLAVLVPGTCLDRPRR